MEIEQKVILLKTEDPLEFEVRIEEILAQGWLIKSIIPRHNSTGSSYNVHGHVIIFFEREKK
jgi:hypothetical protein